MKNVISFPVRPLIGTWVSAEDDNDVEYTVSAVNGLVVTGRDASDGEEFVISDVAWNGTALSFRTLMPSTNHEARHSLKATQNRNVIEHELTIVEMWKRIRSSMNSEEASLANSSHPLAGTWIAVEEDGAAEFTIVPRDNSFNVCGRDRHTEEALLISGVSWDGNVLRFHSFVPSSQFGAAHAVCFREDLKMMQHQLTLLEIWKRKE